MSAKWWFPGCILAAGFVWLLCGQRTEGQSGDAAMKERARLTQEFRGQYGRLCVLVAQALRAGHDEAAVVQSALGLGERVAPVHERLREQSACTADALAKCHAAKVPDDDTVEAAYDARAAVNEEWDIQLPSFAGKVPA